MYHICGIFWYHKRARNSLLMFRSQKTWYHRMEGNGWRLSRASRCMWINPLVVWTPAFIWEVTFNPKNSLISFFMGIFANEQGTGIKTRSLFERLYQCQNITHDGLNSHPLLGNDNSRWTIRSMICCFSKSRASPILQNLLITFSVCSSTSCRSCLTMWGLLRATAEVALFFAFQWVYLPHTERTSSEVLSQ